MTSYLTWFTSSKRIEFNLVGIRNWPQMGPSAVLSVLKSDHERARSCLYNTEYIHRNGRSPVPGATDLITRVGWSFSEHKQIKHRACAAWADYHRVVLPSAGG